jgi:hypothetical protein
VLIQLAFTNKENINTFYLNSFYLNKLIICAKLLSVRPVRYRLKSQTVRSEPDRLLSAGPLEPCLPALFMNDLVNVASCSLEEGQHEK